MLFGLFITYSMREVEKRINKKVDKAVMFFSSANVTDLKCILDFGVSDHLVSYFYLRKREKEFLDLFQQIKSMGGLFMTDSGGFSFIMGKVTTEHYTEEFWLPYLEKYVQWLYDHKGLIFSAANLDLDNFVGREVVDRWNQKYFEPLEKDMNIVYLAHRDRTNTYYDPTGIKRVRELCERYHYVGVNDAMKKNATKIYQIAEKNKTLIHGFAWTAFKILRSFPVFSYDSSSYLSGVRYGTSYLWDGANIRIVEKSQKYRRKAKKFFVEDNGLNYESLMRDERFSVNKFNALAFLGIRNKLLKIANIKLWNKPVMYYEKGR